MMPTDLVRLLLRDEGIRLDPYRDSLGFWTIGVGHLIDRRKGGEFPSWVRSFPITETEAIRILSLDLDVIEAGLMTEMPWLETSAALPRLILTAMAFQLGVGGLMKFVRFLAAVKEQRWGAAGTEMRSSAWYRQAPLRAGRMASALETGDVRYLKLPT